MEYVKNYAILNKTLFGKLHCMYIDYPDYIADEIFRTNGIHVKFGKEYYKEGNKYGFIFCKIKQRDKDKFVKCMDELMNKMLLLGFRDYEFECNRMLKIFNEED